MAEGKYAKYVIPVKPLPGAEVPMHEGKLTDAFVFSKQMFAESVIAAECKIITGPGALIAGRETTIINGKKVHFGTHVHNNEDEAFFFIGTNPDDPTDLGAEYEFWLGEGKDAERYVFDKTTCIYVPKGVPHNPHFARRVDRPFIEFMIFLAPHIKFKPSEFPTAFEFPGEII
jgi:mannose-6-phosphate isomerase-like protein (cupin superfamily)